MKLISRAKNFVFYAVLFTLPMYMRLNNVFLVAFFALFLLEGDLIYKWKQLKKHYKLMLPLFALFALAILAALNHPVKSVDRYLEMYWSFFAIPIVIITSKDYDGEKGKQVFLSLLLGCIGTLLICYGNVVYEMIVGKEPLHYFLRHRHLNHEFTEIADTHPAYLGLFMICSTAYLLFNSTLKKNWKVIVIVFFAFAMIQLASRMAMVGFTLVILLFAFLRLKKYWKQMLVGGTIAAICGILLFLSASEFLRDRLVNTENFENDKRFSRNIVSLELFKEYPLFGVGFGRKDLLRKEKYEAYGFTVASENKYNAHNQYLEYLSVNGIIGGMVFIVIAVYLLHRSWKHKSTFFFLVFLTFFMANTTESMLVRIKGVEFFAITVSLLATTTMKLKENEDFDHA